MIFNKHFEIEGQHAFLGASKYHWLGYDEKKLADVYLKSQAAKEGSELHEFAAQCIRLGQKLPKNKKTLNMYVNDAIGYKMTPEQVLYFSENCFGTADAIAFRDNLLRVHDFKSGVTQAHMEQLYIYCALFCLEYRYDPTHIQIETRIYQSNEVLVANPEPETIMSIANKIVAFDKVIQRLKLRGKEI